VLCMRPQLSALDLTWGRTLPGPCPWWAGACAASSPTGCGAETYRGVVEDVHDPGATSTLTDDPASAQLQGVYDQAALPQRFPVGCVRMPCTGRSLASVTWIPPRMRPGRTHSGTSRSGASPSLTLTRSWGCLTLRRGRQPDGKILTSGQRREAHGPGCPAASGDLRQTRHEARRMLLCEIRQAENRSAVGGGSCCWPCARP